MTFKGRYNPNHSMIWKWKAFLRSHCRIEEGARVARRWLLGSRVSWKQCLGIGSPENKLYWAVQEQL